MSDPAGATPFPESILTVAQEDLDETPMTVVAGSVPNDIWGHAFMLSLVGQVDSPPVPNSSNVAPSAGGNPLYNGMGMVCRFDFDPSGTVKIKTKVTKPASYYADRVTVAGTPGAEYGFSNYGLARLSPWLGVRDALNTGMVPMQFKETAERLLVTCDVGRPYEIDPVSLDIVTPIGGNDEWDEQLPLDLPFPMVTNTAHPVFDRPSQTLFTVNFTKSLGTLLAQLLKSDDDRLSQLVRKIIAEFIHFLESPFNRENLHLFQDFKELLKIIAMDLEEIPQLLEEFWHDFYEILQDIIKDQESLDELKQVLNDGRQMLEGFSKVKDCVYLMC
jgi:carotenoid cleavage dioxygenase-like enzyme